MTRPALSVVVPAKNEAANIEACLAAFAPHLAKGTVETIVVDNSSADGTASLARAAGAAVFTQGPERSAQRNRGWKEASAPWVLFLDADMVVPPAAIEEILGRISSGGDIDCWWIPEVRTGRGWRVKARNFERSFYNGTAIDALRLFRRDVLEKTGGYDERLWGAEDWDLDIRVLAAGAKCAILDNGLFHNEKNLSFSKMLAKKAYYAKSFSLYREKWPDHPAVKRQFSLFYRFFGVFFEKGKWRRTLRHPALYASVLLDRFAVGAVYLISRIRSRRRSAREARRS